jgi:hypothetical protein
LPSKTPRQSCVTPVAEFFNSIGPVPSSGYITTCPQLAKAAVRAADEGAGLTHLYGPAARCKKISSIWRMCGLASMYPASRWGTLLRAIMDISARAISLAARLEPNGSPVFAGAGKTDRALLRTVQAMRASLTASAIRRQLGVTRARHGSGSEFNESDCGKPSFLW